MSGELLEAFVAASSADDADAWRSLPDLDAALQDLVTRARVEVGGDGTVDGPTLSRAAARRVSTPATTAAIERLHAGDLWLADRAADGDPRSVEAIERRYGAAVDAALADAPASERDEVRQQLREKLYVGPPRRIEAYLGRGPLRAWLKVSARRAWLDHQKAVARRREQRPSPDAALLDSLSEDAELVLLKDHYRAEVLHAMDVALADLQPRDRNMLRQHVVFGLKLGEVARLNDVHRATIHRWLGTVRGQLRQRVRQELCRRLGVDDGDLSSIVRIVRSRLDLPL